MPLISHNVYIKDKVQHGTDYKEYILLRVTLCSRSEVVSNCQKRKDPDIVLLFYIVTHDQTI